MRFASGATVRAMIARLYLRSAPSSPLSSPLRLGRITLRAHQQDALDRLRPMMADRGGAMLADDVGLGKTYVALALAREADAALVIAPAALRPMWTNAAGRAGVGVTFASYESLSHGTLPARCFDFIVLDEAHHARTTGTRRYQAIAAMAARARVLLLSATPIHNRRSDLLALFALFLGAGAYALDDDAIARLIVRRTHADLADGPLLPRLVDPEWIATGDDELLLDDIIALPSPLPARGAGDGGALLAVSLARQWASSRAALVGALRRRLVRATALSAALEAGHYPSVTEVASWAVGDGAVQLGFAELLAPPEARWATLLRQVTLHASALRALLRRATRPPDVDDARVRCLVELRARHPAERIVAFSHSADTVRRMYRGLRNYPGVCALSAAGGVVAGGAISRRAAIERFAPAASGVDPPRAIERVDLLITTDLLSEGVNLQDASVVVHLDLPWTSARLAQRVGRSRRLGATHARTSVYALAPPASAEAMLRVEQRLRHKASLADTALGRTISALPARGACDPVRDLARDTIASGVVATDAIVPDLVTPATVTPDAVAPDPAAVRGREQLIQMLTSWIDDAETGLSPPLSERDETFVAAVRSPSDGVLALAHDGERDVLVAHGVDAGLTDDVVRVAQVVGSARGEDVPIDDVALTRVLLAAHAWLAERAGASAAGGAGRGAVAADARRQALRCIARVTARASPDQRPARAALAARARDAVTASFGVGAERVLGKLVGHGGDDDDDDEWLRAVIAFGDTHCRVDRSVRDGGTSHVVALLLLQRAADARADC